MGKGSRILAGFAALLYVLQAYLQWLEQIDVGTLNPMYQPLAKHFRPAIPNWVLGVAVIGVVLQILREASGEYRFRKTKIRKVLDLCVNDLLEGDGKANRLTLFRVVPGWKAKLITLARIWHQDDRLRGWCSFWRIKTFSSFYLIMHVRAMRGMNDRSCAAFRVYRTRATGAEGMAGSAWERDYCLVRDLKTIDAGAAHAITSLEDEAEIQLYAANTNLKTAEQVRLRETFARHFAGIAIENDDGVKWGVLLVDSTLDQCPFGNSRQQTNAFSKQFAQYAKVIGQIVT